MKAAPKEDVNYAIVDGNWYMHRSRHAFASFTNKNGQSTGVLFGFFRLLFSELRDHLPNMEQVYVVFDGELGTEHRKKIYSKYKANRTEKHEVIGWSLDYIARLCNSLKWIVIHEPQYEGDDVINALANRLRKKGTVYILTRDKDMFACVKENVYVFEPVTKTLYNKHKVKKKYGIYPKLLRMYLAITGDGVDNIPGVKGFGPVTARKVCLEHKTVAAALKEGPFNAAQRKKFAMSYRLVKPMITTMKVPKYEPKVSHKEAHRILEYFEVKSLVQEFRSRGVKK